MKYSFALVFLLILFSCQSDKEQRQETIKSIDVEVELIRFDSIFMNTATHDINKLKKEYQQFFPADTPDSLWIKKRQDSLMQVIYQEVEQQFSSTDSLENQLQKLFQHYKYYFPKKKIPKVYTVAEYVDYKNKVLLSGNDLIISLDNYLGKDHRFYAGFEDYISKLQSKHQILPDVVDAFSEALVNNKKQRSFIALMINYGKTEYLKDRLIPFVAEHYRLGYTEAELEWAYDNEKQMWRYFVEKELIYSTKKNLMNRFLYNGPFSKFYLKFDKESPPRLGRFIGRQIIKSYVEQNPEISLEKLMKMPGEKLFQASNYKP